MSRIVRVAVTGAAGQIGYALLPRIASGAMFGSDVEVHLNLLELEAALPALNGVKMELDDCAFPLLRSITVTADLDVAFADADWALLVGSVPRKKGMERGDLLQINGKIFISQGRTIKAQAKPDCKTLVVGNPCNTNAYIARAAGDLAAENVYAMTMLDQKRAMTQLAQKAGVHVTAVRRVAVWGNHSTTQFPDFLHATIDGRPAPEVIGDDAWLQSDFLTTVQKRGAAIIEARGLSSAASAANAVVETVASLTRPTPADDFFSVAVPSDGSYGIPEGLLFSFPIRSDGANREIVQGIEHDDFAQGKVDATRDELEEERAAVADLL